jgi:hypothetical protein
MKMTPMDKWLLDCFLFGLATFFACGVIVGYAYHHSLEITAYNYCFYQWCW